MGQKQKTERKEREKKKKRPNDGNNNGQAMHGAGKYNVDNIKTNILFAYNSLIVGLKEKFQKLFKICGLLQCLQTH